MQPEGEMFDLDDEWMHEEALSDEEIEELAQAEFERMMKKEVA